MIEVQNDIINILNYHTKNFMHIFQLKNAFVLMNEHSLKFSDFI